MKNFSHKTICLCGLIIQEKWTKAIVQIHLISSNSAHTANPVLSCVHTAEPILTVAVTIVPAPLIQARRALRRWLVTIFALPSLVTVLRTLPSLLTEAAHLQTLVLKLVLTFDALACKAGATRGELAHGYELGGVDSGGVELEVC